jgi:hypothetical protein
MKTSSIRYLEVLIFLLLQVALAKFIQMGNPWLSMSRSYCGGPDYRLDVPTLVAIRFYGLKGRSFCSKTEDNDCQLSRGELFFFLS